MMMDKVEDTLVDLMECLARCEGIESDTQQDILILMARLEGLEPRPQPDHKEGEGVEWDGEGIAPAGITARCARYANPVKVLFSTNQVAVVESDWGEQRALDPELVLPLKSRRDKVIKAAYDALDKRELGCCEWQEHARRIFEQLYDAGALKLPGEEVGGKDKYRDRLIQALSKAVTEAADWNMDSGELEPNQDPWVNEAESLLDEIRQEASDDQ